MFKENEEIVLEIAELNNEGFGKAYYQNKYPIIVEKTLPGDLVKVRITKKFSNYILADLKQVLKPSVYRIEAECKYFSKCGGCSLQHYTNYSDYKNSILKLALQELKFTGYMHDMYQVNKNSRRRVSFKVNESKLGFNKTKSHQIISIPNCLLLEKEINELINPINKLIYNFKKKIDKVNIMSSDTGIELLFISKQKTDMYIDFSITKFAEEYNISRIAWQVQENKPFVLIQRKPVQLSIGNLKIDLPVNSFLQSTKQSHEYMSQIILKHLVASETIELYCGCGGFTIPISTKANKVLAIEGNEEAVLALKTAAKNFNLPINVLVQDLFQNPVKANIINSYSQVVINPPRNGASPQIKEISLSRSVKKVILISCSITNFVRDSKILLEAGFKLTYVYPIDQFLYSTHLEIIGIFNNNL